MSEKLATGIGFGAVLLWALLALLTELSGEVPPFQLAAMTFALGGIAGAVVTIARGKLDRLRQPLSVWALGVGGLFGYHFLYFTALRNAPAVEAGLIAYLWPLLIVLGSTLVTGRRLKPSHVIGALLGFAGAALLVTRDSGLGFNTEYAFGYGIALAAAFVWSSYSVLSRRFASVPATRSPMSLAVLGLGLGPVGLAFFIWDIGVKHGDISVLGASSYGAPLLSTLILVLAGAAEPSWTIFFACVLITGGAFIAAQSMLRRQ